MTQVRGVAARHPSGVDAALAAALAAAAAPAALGSIHGGAGWVWFAAAFVLLVWRRRAPVAVFWAVLAVSVAVWTVARADSGYPLVALLTAVYTVAGHRSWRPAWLAAGAVAALLVAAWWQGELLRADLLALTAALATATLLGITVRTRRAYVVELEERARRLERDRDQRAKLAVGAERARIARETHDIVAHNLAVMVALADGAALIGVADPRRAVDVLATISTTGRQALDEMGRLLGLLRDGGPAAPAPAGRSPQPGLDDIDRLVEQVRDTGLRVTVVREGTPGGGPGAGLTIYRLVQEALTNTLKHAGRDATAEVRLRHTGAGAELEITDDGANRPARAPAGPPAPGHGLAGAAERVAAYNGRFEAGPLPGAGWRVYATLSTAPPEETT